MNPRYALVLALLVLVALGCRSRGREHVPITIEHVQPRAPITVGVPFSKGALHSPSHVRLLNADGEEVPAQVTPVTTWAPADSSLKWIWVFFFANEGDTYELEYGPTVERAPITGERIRFVNNQRPYGTTRLSTGPLRFDVNKGDGGGFLDEVEFDAAGDGFGPRDTIATEPTGRGSFLDLLDRAGIDSSRATVTQTYKEKGSGPLHAILRIEGKYQYSRDDNNAAPFVTRIHAYAGKPYLRVLHTITYTGDPDQHPPIEGQHGMIATSAEDIVDEKNLENDPRWTQPADQIAGMGLSLDYRLRGPLTVRTAYRKGDWWNPDGAQVYERRGFATDRFSVVQTGPDSASMPTGPNSSSTERVGGFSARITANGTEQVDATRAPGWIDVTGEKKGVAVGIRHFTEAYPKELAVDGTDRQLRAYAWSGTARPMNFARWSGKEDGGMVDNFAQGLTKTTEYVYRFHRADADPAAVQRSLDHVIDPAVAHVPPSRYAESRVYGHMAPRSDAFAAIERGLDYKFQWWRFNQKWEPWYGAFTYGDGKNYFYRDRWFEYSNNEPAQDYILWTQFMRTGERDYAIAAEAMSRHTMDVDNIHWPVHEDYRGDSNAALDWWKANESPPGSPYVGMGRRHGKQHWTALLSAHVWVPGWLASYYLNGYHRGLEVARKTGAYYRRRIFEKHGLTGRRLYLSVWNLVELYDATKDPRLREELDARVERMLRLQEEQGGSLIIDRYGYAQVYVARGLGKYYQLTGDPAVRDALIRHARWVRDNPPHNHEMESYLSSISALLMGYTLSGDRSLYRVAYERAQALKTDPLPIAFEEAATQDTLFHALNEASRLPRSREHPDRRPIWGLTNGLRVFGWTHAYNVPYLVHWLEEEGPPSRVANESTTP